MRVAVLTVSDRASRGDYVDEGGPLVERFATDAGGEIVARAVVPDERADIEARLQEWCARADVDVILTTGGTGFGARDVTPEATRAVIDREAPGLAEAMRAAGRASTPFADLSRGVAGIVGSALVVNLPGSPRGAVESLEAILRVIPHALEHLAGDTVHTDTP
jgi:molybdenum cofactor synthesis domain-containing protein